MNDYNIVPFANPFFLLSSIAVPFVFCCAYHLCCAVLTISCEAGSARDLPNSGPVPFVEASIVRRQVRNLWQGRDLREKSRSREAEPDGLESAAWHDLKCS